MPPEGLAAESQGDWQKAIEIYQETLRQEPARPDLWLRIADIEAHLGHPEKAAAALEEAAKLSPDDADIFYRLSEAYSTANQPQPAFEAIARAVELEPDNIEYLESYGQLANWVDKPELAAEAYEKLMVLLPNDDSVLLGYAQSNAWGGHLDRAACAYKEYLDRNPEVRYVYIQYAQVEAWRGNYPAALDILEQYAQKFGESKDYLQEKAAVYAWADRPSLALPILADLLEDEPDNYDQNYAKALSLYHDNRPVEAIETLDKLTALRPDSKDTYDLRRFILTPFRSNVDFETSFYSDSDDLERWRNTAIATYWLNPLTSFVGGVEATYLTADKGSGLEELDGGENNWHTSGWLGASRRLNPDISIDGYAGAADADGNSHFIYGAGLDYQPLDTLDLRLQRTYGYYVVSPRTIDLGIREGANQVFATWEPNLLYTVVAQAGFNTFSDDNEEWEALLAPRRAFLRTEKFNLDIGVRGNWFGFKDNLDNGYYDPDFYQSYGVTGFGYWKISDDDGISVVLDAGMLKDDTMDNFRFGMGGTVEGVFGLYRDVMLRVGLAATNNSRQTGGAFRAFTVYAGVTFRF